MNRAARIRRGFYRLGTLGISAAIFVAAGSLFFEYRQPSGAIYATSLPNDVTEYKATPLVNVTMGDYSKRSEWDTFLEGPEGGDFTLLDGRNIRYYLIPSSPRKDLMALNAAIAKHEFASKTPFDLQGDTFRTVDFFFKCPGWRKCDAPFPNGAQSHLSRAMSVGVATLTLGLGVAWFLIMALISWIIRGFMDEAHSDVG